jgi:hypothetical protein
MGCGSDGSADAGLGDRSNVRFHCADVCPRSLVLRLAEGHPLLLPRGAIALTPPCPIASVDLVHFDGSGFVSVATALLTKRRCTDLDAGPTTAALGLPG